MQQILSELDPESFYSAEGMHRATVTQHLYPLLHNTFAYCGMSVLQPFIIHNTTAASKDELESQIKSYQKLLQTIEHSHQVLYR